MKVNCGVCIRVIEFIGNRWFIDNQIAPKGSNLVRFLISVITFVSPQSAYVMFYLTYDICSGIFKIHN